MVNVLILHVEITKVYNKSFEDRMVNACSVTYCKTGYKHKGQTVKHHSIRRFSGTKGKITHHLRWDFNLIPSFYSDTDSIPLSVLPTLKTSRKLLSVRN